MMLNDEKSFCMEIRFAGHSIASKRTQAMKQQVQDNRLDYTLLWS